MARGHLRYRLAVAAATAIYCACPSPASTQPNSHGTTAVAAAPSPLADGDQADWLFVFKLNAKRFPTPEPDATRPCPFGAGTPHPGPVGLAYAYATNKHAQLRAGTGLAGTGSNDPLGATFGQIWNGNYYYVVWNDQFYQHPLLDCAKAKSRGVKNKDGCDQPWGHSKGILAWNDDGAGLIIQVTTPDWPGAGSKAFPRAKEGNTLGCIATDDDVIVSQHFFALKLSEPDVEHVLDALANASIVTDPNEPTLVRNGGPATIRGKVAQLGHPVSGKSVFDVTLSSGVRLISKPSKLLVAPWQLISSLLAPAATGHAASVGIGLRTATWWGPPIKIPTTTQATPVDCRLPSLPKPGEVQIATSGMWAGKPIGLEGKVGDGNHAKIGVSLSGSHPYTIFGDMNQQGKLGPVCNSAQNQRGGLFFVVDNQDLHDSVQSLITGCTAPQVLSAGAARTLCVLPKPKPRKAQAKRRGG
jgi:hypothetical protein